MESSVNYKIAIINGKLFYDNDFADGVILIKNNKINDVIIGKKVDIDLSDYKIIDAADCIVSYGFFDPHVHFRTPGAVHKEDWITGAKAAVKGGFTFVIDMPNNNPPAIDYETIKDKYEIAKKTFINFGFYIGITDENSQNIKSIYNKLNKDNIPVYGLKGFLGSSTGSLLIKKDSSINNVLKTGLICLFHSEDEEELKKYDQIKYNSIFDHNKIRPPAAALAALQKIAKNAKGLKNKCNIYICHVSSKDEVKIIQEIKQKGFKIYSEITPHHLFFNLDNIKNSNIFKVNPPIRSSGDVSEIRKKFNEGFFDIIGTDHAPHLLCEKKSDKPPSGMPGLESAFYALYNLYERKIINLNMIFKLLINGYKIFKIKNRGKIKKGFYADLVLIKKKEFIFKSKDTFTKADFSPFDGLKTKCMIDTVIINGKIILHNGNFI